MSNFLTEEEKELLQGMGDLENLRIGGDGTSGSGDHSSRGNTIGKRIRR
jgi:hypothetical protein